MTTLLIIFWTAVIFGSIAWYAALLFYVGFKGGWEIFRMTRSLRERPEEE